MYRKILSSLVCAGRPSGLLRTSSWAKQMLINTKNIAQLTTTTFSKTQAAAVATSMELSSFIHPSLTLAANARSSSIKWKMMKIIAMTATFPAFHHTSITWHPRLKPCKFQTLKALARTSWRMRRARTPLSLTYGQEWIRFASTSLLLRSRRAAKSCWSVLSSQISGRTSQRHRRSLWTKRAQRTLSAAQTRSGSWLGAPRLLSLPVDA